MSEDTPTQEAASKGPAKKQELPEDVLVELRRHLLHPDNDTRQLNIVQLMQFLETLEEDYRTPYIEGVVWSPLNDKKRFEELELSPANLSIETLLVKGYVEQEVKILGGMASVRFRSSRMYDDAFLQSWTHAGGDRYDKLDAKGYSDLGSIKSKDMLVLMDAAPSLMTLNELSIAVTKLNGAPLGGVEDIYEYTEGSLPQPKLDLAIKKRDALAMMDVRLIQEITLHLRAFEQRVMALYNPEAIQNF